MDVSAQASHAIDCHMDVSAKASHAIDCHMDVPAQASHVITETEWGEGGGVSFRILMFIDF
jgi:hypothetical protein